VHRSWYRHHRHHRRQRWWCRLGRLTHTIAQRVGRYLDRQDLIERDAGNIFLTQDTVDASDEDPTNQSIGKTNAILPENSKY